MPWLADNDLRASGIRLFCLPHAGAGVAGFYRWKRLLPPSIAVCPVQLPGRERRLSEPSVPDAKHVVAQILQAARGCFDEPYAIFGHSMGALLGYELASQIASANLPMPKWLFVSGRNAPQLEPTHRDLHLLPDEAFLAALRERFGGSQDDVLAVPELRELYLPILRADLQLVESYATASSRLDCPVAAFAGFDDYSVSAAGLKAWSEVSAQPVVVERFAGDHFYHLGAGQQALLAAIVRSIG